MKRIISVLLPIILIVGITFLIYSRTFHGPFQYDDKEFIINNTNILDIKDLSGLFRIHSSRIVVFTTFALNYHFHKLRVFGYHVVNFTIHIISVLLVWWFARLMFFLYTKQTLTKNLYIAAMLASLIFATHPVQTQAVSYITQRFASMATMFYLLTICLYIKGRLSAKGKIRQICFFAGAICSGVLGMFTKEEVITLPIMLLYLEFEFIKPFLLSRLGNKNAPKAPVSRKDKKIILFILPFIFLIPLFSNIGLLEVLFAPRASESHLDDVFNLWTYGLTQLRVIMHFIRLLLVPFYQNVNYDFPMSHSLLELKTFGSLLVLAALIAGAVRLRKYNPLFAFGMFWFFITLSVNFIPRSHVIFEHKLYLASVGPCIALLFYLLNTFKNFYKFMLCITIIISTFSYLTFQRNKVWQDEIALWKDIAKKSPKKAIAWGNLGSIYTSSKMYDEAMVTLNKALSIKDDYISSVNNRGFVYMETGYLDKALEDFNRAIQIAPEISIPYTNKAKVLKQKGRLQEALEILSKAIEINPKDFEAFNLRGSIYGGMKYYERALSDFKQCVKINPNYGHPYNNLSLIEKFRNNLDQSLIYINRAIELDPRNTEFYLNRAVVYVLKNELEPAFRDCNIALQLNPGLVRAYNQRGVIYGKSKQFDPAIADFKKAIELEPSYAEAHNNLGMAYKLKNLNDLALYEFNKAIELSQDYASAYYNRGLLYQMRGDTIKAQLDFQKAQSLMGK